MSGKQEESAELPVTDFCNKHAQDYVLFCKQCSELLCSICTFDGCHKEHLQSLCPLESYFTEVLLTVQMQEHLVQEEELATQANIKEIQKLFFLSKIVFIHWRVCIFM